MTQAPPVTLADFLRAQFDREERLARHAESVWQVIRRDPKPYPGVAHHRDDWMKAEAFSLNINPWFILKQVEAKRRIVEQYEFNVAALRLYPKSEATARAVDELDNVLRRLALPYAGHASYRQEWAP